MPIQGEITGDSIPSVAFYGFAKFFREQIDFPRIKDWIKFFEVDYNCAGICKPALFSWMRSIEAGRPNQSCIASLKDDVADSLMGLGVVGLVSGILLFAVFISQYCLWKKYE